MIACASIIQNRRVLLVRHASEQKLDYGHWILPAGKVEAEESLEDGLKREIKEETGLDIMIVTRLAEHIDPYTGDKLFNYLCAPTTSEIRINSELQQAKWFNVNEINNVVNIHPGLKDFLISLLKT